MDALLRDLRHAWRTLARTPGFTLVVLLTMALGIGANTAIFSLTDQLLLRRLPVRDPGALVTFENPGAFSGRTHNENTFSYPMYRDFRDRNSVFDGVLASFLTDLTLGVDGHSERVAGELVSGNYFDVLGVRPLVGRALSSADDRAAGAGTSAMLGYGFWMRRFAGDLSMLNRVVDINGHPMTIVGITPPGFYGIVVGQAADVLVPVTLKAQMTPTWDDLENRRSRWLTLVARRKPGVSIAQAEAAMNVLYRQINEMEVKDVPAPSPTFKDRFLAKHLFVRPGARGQSDLRRQFYVPMLVLMGMVGLVLLIACANVANLLLARSAARQKEVAIRLALGAGRAAVVRQRLVESVLLALSGAVLGVIAAWRVGDLIVKALPSDGGTQTLSATPDLRVLLFALAVSLCTALLSGLGPALQSTRPQLTSTLKNEAGSVAGGVGHARIRKALVITQVGLSVLLLAGAALFARSLYNLKVLDPGFNPDRLMAFSVDPSLSGYSRERSVQYFGEMRRRIEAIPGVTSAAASELPLMTSSDMSSTVRVQGYEPKEGENMNPWINVVGPGYFATLGQTLVAGREFTERDVPGAQKVAVVNETMARYFFGSSNPIGRRIGWRRTNDVDIEIVGVVRDAKSGTLRDETHRFVYTPYMQNDAVGRMTFYVRLRDAATDAASVIRAAAAEVDPNLPIFEMKSMTTQVDQSLFTERMVAALSVAFGGLATLLAAIGLYGVMSYSVARRTREIGVRMALGAERASVLWLILREVAIMVAIGVAAGLPLAYALGRVVASQLFALSAHDPVALLLPVLVLTAVAIVAGYVPARRATRIDPIVALRYE